MTRDEFAPLRRRRSFATAVLLLLLLAVALVAGRWLAIAEAPASRHVVARTLLENGAADKAAHVFETPIWKGVALYRAGRFQRSVGAFVTDNSVTGLYNMGNAYARLGLYEGAITAYETVLRRRPDHGDARFNLRLVRAAAERALQLENESRESEHAGGWQDGLRERQERNQPGPSRADAPPEGDDTDPPDRPEGRPDDEGGDAEAGETATSVESSIAGDLEGGKERDGEKVDASDLSLTHSGDRDADGRPPDGSPTDDIDVVGSDADRAREQAMADEILLRRITDDPAVVLRARLEMALRRQKEER